MTFLTILFQDKVVESIVSKFTKQSKKEEVIEKAPNQRNDSALEQMMEMSFCRDMEEQNGHLLKI